MQNRSAATRLYSSTWATNNKTCWAQTIRANDSTGPFTAQCLRRATGRAATQNNQNDFYKLKVVNFSVVFLLFTLFWPQAIFPYSPCALKARGQHSDWKRTPFRSHCRLGKVKKTFENKRHFKKKTHARQTREVGWWSPSNVDTQRQMTSILGRRVRMPACRDRWMKKKSRRLL